MVEWTPRQLVFCYSVGRRKLSGFDPGYTRSWQAVNMKQLQTLWQHLLSVCPCIVDNMKRVNPTRCYAMVYWTLWIAQHVSGIIMPIIRSLRLYRWPQRVAPDLGYGRLLVWCMAVGLSVRLEGCCTFSGIIMPIIRSLRLYSNLHTCTRPATCHNQGEVPHPGAICIVTSFWW